MPQANSATIAEYRVFPRSSSQSAFTLIELSIVLVIIGLIAGGVLVGQQLIEAARVRAMIRDVDKIKTAINTFRLKYNCLPGDCPNATSFLSGVTDGDGNKTYTFAEGGQAKTQLVAAKLWESSSSPYFLQVSGLKDTVNSSTSGALIFTNISYDTGGYPALNSNTITLTGLCGWNPAAGVVRTPDAYSIDSKIDDSSPTSGRVHARSGGELKYYSDQCTAQSSLTYYTCIVAGAYDYTNTSNKCRLVFPW